MPFCSFSEGAAMFDVTPIENMFLLEYLPTAPESCLRVYLYARMLCLHPELCGEIQDMAKALRMEEDQVFEAFSYWERQGLAERLSDRPPRYALLPLRTSTATQSPAMEREYYEYRDFNASLQDRFGGDHLLHPQQFKTANDWLNVLGFTQDAVLAMLDYELQRSRVRDPYRVFKKLDKTAADWAERGIRTAEDVKRAILYDERVYAVADKVMKQFAMRRQPTVNELDCVRRWVHTWQLDEAEILDACAETTKSRAPSIAYLDAILKSRRENGAGEQFDELREALRELGSGAAVPTPEQRKKYEAWRKSGFEAETVRLAAVQCARKRKNSFEELEWMLGSWDKAGIRTRAEAENYVADMQRASAELRTLLEAAGLTRRPQMDDLNRYNAWRKQYSAELIQCAAETARGTNTPMRYMEKLLSEWEKAGITTAEAARARAAAGKPAVAGAVKPAQQNYQQRTYTEADLAAGLYYDPLKEMMDGGAQK